MKLHNVTDYYCEEYILLRKTRTRTDMHLKHNMNYRVAAKRQKCTCNDYTNNNYLES